MPSSDDLLREAGIGSTGGGSDTPPSSSEAGFTPRSKPDSRLTPKWAQLSEGLHGFYTAASVAAFALGDSYTAELIRMQQDACVEAWVELAKKDTRVEKFLVRLTTGSAWGGVIMAHAGILLPVLARRGILPGGALFGGFGADAAAAAGNGASSPPSPDAAAEAGFVTADQNGAGN